ncbi:MAG: hydrogenase maturation nickel metallochaperone HypA [Eubacterium sp.]|nr:hydrogenase maturation nickel metallochaperone HypA [Eubacterium sp.]
MSYVVRLVNLAIDEAKENSASKVEKVVATIGEMTGIEPEYMHKYYKTAIKGTILEDSELIIEPEPVMAKCDKCGITYHPTRELDYLCPDCMSGLCHITAGRTFMLKEIHVKD